MSSTVNEAAPTGGAEGAPAASKPASQPVPALVRELGLLTFEELIRQTGLPKKYVRRLVSKGVLPAIRIGKTQYFDKEAIQERLGLLAYRYSPSGRRVS